MKTASLILGATALFLITLGGCSTSQWALSGGGARGLRAGELRCEYLNNPLGVEEPSPRLSWIVAAPRRGEHQSAYHVLVASSPGRLAQDEGDLWDSGKVTSAETTQIVYAGKPLSSRQSCFWKVRAWDRDTRPGRWSPVASWEMGLLKPSDWSARWIDAAGIEKQAAADTTLEGATWIWSPQPGHDLTREAPEGDCWLRRSFVLPPERRLQQAQITITADDSYALSVNGCFFGATGEPDGWKRPHRHDITAALKPGKNVLLVSAHNKGAAAGLAAKLELRFADSEPQVIVTDGAWKVSDKAVGGWDALDFDDGGWKHAAEIAPVGQGVWGKLPGLSQDFSAPILRKTLTLAGQPVARARLTVTALGLYEMRLNGQRVGDHLLAPDWTDYEKRVRYQVYDVAALLRPGRNALAGLLGHGWYSGVIAGGGFHVFGTRPALLAQLEVTYADGRTERFQTDATWKVHRGPILSSDLMGGENYDARSEIQGWDQPELDDSQWPAATARDEASRSLSAQVMKPVRQLRELRPKALSEPSPGRWVFDLGQNMVGVARLKVSAPAGARVMLRYAEMLNPDGTLYTTNLRGAREIDTYTCKGGGGEQWQPRFTCHGFRYVEVSGLAGKPALDTVTGVVIGSDTPRTGEFACSDPRINQLESNIEWGQRGNYLSIPTDCPQRDERLGWTGDAQIFIRTAACNADVAAFFTKWLVDLDDVQHADGAYTDITPITNAGGGTPAWGDAGVICPWTLYLAYGDTRILERHLPNMIRWIEWCRAHSDGLIRDRDRGGDYGDWLSIGADTPKDLIGTAYFAYSTHLVARSAQALGQTEVAAQYEKLFAQIKAAFNKRYVAADGRIQGNTQCAYAMALKFDLLPEALRPKAAQVLAEDIKARGGRLSTGFVGVSYLLPTLTGAGKLDTAYGLLLQDAFPSWLFSVKHGATTIWERWDGWTPEKGFQDPGMNSFNHYSLGSCGEWLYDTVAGIGLDPERPGYRHILIRPRPGGGLSSARASLRSIHGRIASAWALGGGQFHLDLTIPANTTATVYVPAPDAHSIRESGRPAAEAQGVKFLRMEGGAALFEVGSGDYRFTAPSR